jgi:hypothetical protein
LWILVCFWANESFIMARWRRAVELALTSADRAPDGLVEHLRLVIAKMRRESFGPGAEQQ